jgi:uncharacterized protein
MRTQLALGLLALLGMLAIASNAPAAETGDGEGITVTGQGEVLAKPTHVEISLNASGSAELTGDALTKYRDAVRRTTEAFEKLNLKQLKVEPLGVAIKGSGGAATGVAAQIAAARGQAAGGKPQTDVSRSLRLTLSGIQNMPEDQLMDTLGKVLDVAKDSGAAVGSGNESTSAIMAMIGNGGGQSSSMVTFVVDNADELREKAYQQAFKQARDRAQRLAKLAGGAVGAVVSVQESAEQPTSDKTSIQEKMLSAIYGIGGSSGGDEHRLTSETYADVPIRVTLRVRFRLSDAKGATP